MKTYLVLTLFVTLVICFITDPTPTVAEDTTDRSIERYQYAPLTYNNNNNVNDKDEQKKVSGDVNHSCLNAIHIVYLLKDLVCPRVNKSS
jgi:hypothetical protein